MQSRDVHSVLRVSEPADRSVIKIVADELITILSPPLCVAWAVCFYLLHVVSATVLFHVVLSFHPLLMLHCLSEPSPSGREGHEGNRVTQTPKKVNDGSKNEERFLGRCPAKEFEMYRDSSCVHVCACIVYGCKRFHAYCLDLLQVVRLVQYLFQLAMLDQCSAEG